MRIKLFGIPVEFTFWFFAVAVCFSTLERGALVPYLVLPIVVHELGHMLALCLCGARVKSVRLTAFSVDICKKDSLNLSYKKEIIITLAGIAANFAVALSLYLFAFQSMRVMFLIAANVSVGIFNLLPIGNLDGGALLVHISRHFSTLEMAGKISKTTSFITLVPLFAASIFLIISKTGNITLLLTCIYLAATVAVRE